MKKISRVLAGIPIAAVTALCLQAGPAQALPSPTAPDAPAAPAPAAEKASLMTDYYNFEVSVRTRYSDRIRIWGYNQYDQHVHSPWVNSPNEWTKVAGWWWNNGPTKVNHIAIEGYQVSNGKTRWMNCKLPYVYPINQYDCDGWANL